MNCNTNNNSNHNISTSYSQPIFFPDSSNRSWSV